MELLCYLVEHPAVVNKGSIRTLFQFMNTAFSLKDDILLTQSSKHATHKVPMFLSPAIEQFLSAGCHLTGAEVRDAWILLKEVIWSGAIPMCSDTSTVFERLGRQLGVCKCTPHDSVLYNIVLAADIHLFPPHRMCPAPRCTRTSKGLALHRVRQQEVVLSVLTKVPVSQKWHISTVKVRSCHENSYCSQ